MKESDKKKIGEAYLRLHSHNENEGMTDEEAMKIIKQFRDRQGNSSDDNEALDKAIKMLEQQPCENCISRKEAINVVHKYFVDYLKLNDDICLDGIRSLPSVTSTISKMEQVEDCIDREDAIEQLHEWHAMMTCEGAPTNPLHLKNVKVIEMCIDALELQPSADCISRKAAKVSIQRKIDEVVSKDGSYDYDMKQYIGGLLTAKIAISRNNLPSVTPSRPRGKWIREKRDFLLVYRCSNCKKIIYSRETISDAKYEDLSRVDSYRYCPRCGANMMESEE